MFFKSKQLLGLDIGSNSIKLAIIEISKGKPVLEGFYFVPTPLQAVSGGELTSPQELAGVIGSLVQQVGTKKKETCTGIWGSNVVVKRIQIPKMDKNLLEEQIKFEAEQYIPFNLSEVNLEYHVLTKQSPSPDSMEVILVAAKKDLVMTYAEAVESAGLSLTTVDVAGFAISNTFEINYPNPGVSHIGILNMGATSCNFVVRNAGELVFSRDISFGGFNFTEEIKKNMGVSFEEAENLKFSAADETSPPEVTEIMRSSIDIFVEELTRTRDFYMTSSGMTNPIQRFYLSGGSMNVAGLKQRLEEAIQTPVENFDPFINVSFNSSVITPDYLAQITPYAPVALGLALRKKGDES